MTTEEIKITTGGRPIEAFTMSPAGKPARAFLVLPGKGYTINHFLLDFLWRMAAESGFYSIKAEYRGFTYRHLDEPYDHKHAAIDAGHVINHLTDLGYAPEDIVVCAKSLGTIAACSLVTKNEMGFQKVVLLTPVLYIRKENPVYPIWTVFNERVPETHLVFGTNDPFCDRESAQATFPEATVDCYTGADHGMSIEGDYLQTINIQREIIEKVKSFINT